MSALSKVLTEEIRKIEDTHQIEQTLHKYRLSHHLMPPVGWLNDPNGLCYFKGRYHVFFQYSPFEVEGGLKCWGHYSSEDLIEWRYEGAPLLPDSPNDCHGVYSGSALVEGDRMHLFYTGNVKLDGDYDYINNGRETSTIHVESEDGIHFSEKEVVIPFSAYPEDYTCHIRDPKVWKQGDTYRMVLGGRKKEDKGAVLFYKSVDLKNWSFEREVTTQKPFGYMWECPDYFELEGHKVLSVSPQGLKREEYRYQNIYQSGYFLPGEYEDDLSAESFREWDMGFDFYAPQTFEDGKGRRILIGWMGMPDAGDEYTNPTVSEGWQHCLTLPRVLRKQGNIICQSPVEELLSLRRESREITGDMGQVYTEAPFDMELKSAEDGPVNIQIGEDLSLEYREGSFVFCLSSQAGSGRKIRKARIGRLRDVRILVDTTAVEVYLNEGETVFSSRYYPKGMEQTVKLTGEGLTGRLWKLDKMTFTK